MTAGSYWKRLKERLVGEDIWSGPGTHRLPAGSGSPIADASFRYEGNGFGPAVLLIHGLTGTPNEMRFVGKALAKAGFTVYGMQLAGHCGSEADLLTTGWRDWYASVEAARAELVSRHGSIFVAGLSMGALMALHLAHEHPDTVKGIALYSLTFWHDGWTVPKLGFLLPLFLHTPLGLRYRFIEAYPYGIKDERLRKRVVASMVSGDSAAAGTLGMTGASLRQLYAFIDVLKPELGKIVTPTLIMHSTEDDITSLRNPRYVERRLAGPVKTILLDDCYHMITVDQQRQQVVQETIDFFRGV
jgi:carboxylesterase